MKKLLLLFLSINSIFALEIKGPFFNEKLQHDIYVMSGDFDLISYSTIKKFLSANKDKEIVIIPYSVGGYANDIFEIQDEITAHGNVSFNTTVKGSFCGSVCAFTAMAGKIIKGKYHFHRFELDTQTPMFLSNNAYYSNLIMRDRMLRYGFSKDISNKIIQTPQNSLLTLEVTRNEDIFYYSYLDKK